MSEEHKVQADDTVENPGWLTKESGYLAAEKLYGEIDLDQIPLLDDEDFNQALAEERELRKPLNAIVGGAHGTTELVQQVAEAGAAEELKKWAEVHIRNRKYVLKKGEADIMLTPESLRMLEAAKILSEDN